MEKRIVNGERTIPAHRQPTVVAEPSKGALDDPAAAGAAQRAAILGGRLTTAAAMGHDPFGGARSVRGGAAPAWHAAGRCRRPCRRSPARASASAGPALGLGSPPAWFPRAGLPPGMQSAAGFPEEHPCRRPPPSTSSPCPAWFSRLHRPFFGRGETTVQERFAPLQLLGLV